ncbi:MAG: hypothetical protein GX803_07765 [Lentisphaerae bacterium]|jgi:hypothetical protein|nr:hypothetical protein [Lentisphaerota bacterium]
MKKWLILAAGVWAGTAMAQQPGPMTHAALQAVDEVGESAWVEELPFTIQGVVLNDPEEMLDYSYAPGAEMPPKGGQYQMFIQAVGAGDRGGTALYVAQCSIPLFADHFDEAGWANELQRILFDGQGRKFRKGDVVEVTARQAIFYNGKVNINKAHRTTPDNNFDIALVKANAGLPKAEPITLADLKDGNDEAIFDATRLSGGEFYQGVRVRLDGVRLTDTNGWGETMWADRVCTVEDASGRTLLLRMPLTALGEPPSSWFSAIGILNQEGSNTSGYELFVQEIGPELKMTVSGGRPSVSFSTDYEGFVLEATDDLEGGEWTLVDMMPRMMIVIEDDGDADTRHYRLRKAD